MRELSRGFYSELLRTITGTLEHKPYGVEEGIRGTVILEPHRPEWVTLQGQRRFGAWSFMTAPGVGLSRKFCLLNPEGSGVLVIVERVSGREGSAASAWLAITAWSELELTTTFAIGLGSWNDQGLDTRQGTTHAALIRTSGNAQPGNLGGVSLGAWKGDNTSTNAPALEWVTPIVLEPGWGILVYGIEPSNGQVLANAALFAQVQWREKQLSKGNRV